MFASRFHHKKAGVAAVNLGWNPADAAAGLLITNSNKTINGNGLSWHSARAVQGRTTGKYYWEISLNALSSEAANFGIGICDTAMALIGDPVFNGLAGRHVFTRMNSQWGNEAGYQGDGGYNLSDGVHVLGMAADLNGCLLHLYEDGAVVNVLGWSAGSTTMYPVFSGGPRDSSMDIRTVLSEFTYAPPAGYAPWTS